MLKLYKCWHPTIGIDYLFHFHFSSLSCMVATKIFEGFGEALFKEFIKGREPVSSVQYTRPGTCINHPLH